MDQLQKKLAQRHRTGNLRQLGNFSSLIDFASNDYLGLARCAILADMVRHEMHALPLGSTGSRLLSGNTPYAEELEKSIALFHGYPQALLYNCGYMANVGLLSCIAGKEDTIFYDVMVHASMYDGMRLAQAAAVPCKHNHIEHLEDRLRRHNGRGTAFICIESIYSQDGSLAPMAEIAALANKYQAHLIVDEAHALGIAGPEGRGRVAEFGLQKSVFAQVVTFGKALGAHGAAVLGSRELANFLINFSRPFIYTTALSLPSLALIKCAYQLLPSLEEKRVSLRALIDRIPGAQAPIFPVYFGDSISARQAAEELMHRGFNVRPLLPPSVRKGQEMLRVCLHSYNAQAELQALIKALNHLTTHSLCKES